MNLLSIAGTARTFAANFWPWLLGAFLVGAAVTPYPTFLVTRAVYQRATLQAKNELADWKTARAEEQVAAKDREDKIMRAAKEQYDAQTSSIADIADELRRISAGVRVCTQVSTMRLSQPTVGPATPVAGGEPRPADIVLQELAAEFAKRADLNAAAYNSVMERWEKLAQPQ
jgi:hypothetical protein